MATSDNTDYQIFDMPYKEAYTAKIEFETQINEKQKGREQRRSEEHTSELQSR